MNTQTIHQQTGAAWDQAAANYKRGEAEHIDFLHSGGSILLASEQRILGDLSSWCQKAIHLQARAEQIRRFYLLKAHRK